MYHRVALRTSAVDCEVLQTLLPANWLRVSARGFRCKCRGTSLLRDRAPLGPCGSICLWPYRGPREVAVSYERGSPLGEPLHFSSETESVERSDVGKARRGTDGPATDTVAWDMPASGLRTGTTAWSRGWHTVRQSAPTVWLRRPRDLSAWAGGEVDALTGHARLRTQDWNYSDFSDFSDFHSPLLRCGFWGVRVNPCE